MKQEQKYAMRNKNRNLTYVIRTKTIIRNRNKRVIPNKIRRLGYVIRKFTRHKNTIFINMNKIPAYVIGTEAYYTQ